MNQINKNPVNFSIEQWENIIFYNHSKEVKNFINSMNDKNMNLLKFDTDKKSITNGIHNLSLSILLKSINKTESTKQPLNKLNVKNLAKCLKLSFTADKIEVVQKANKGKRKLSSENEFNRQKKIIKLDTEENIENNENVKEKQTSVHLNNRLPPLTERSLNTSLITLSKIENKIVPLKKLNNTQEISNKNFSNHSATLELHKKMVLMIKLGNIKGIRRLLAQGANVNFLDIKGQPLLHLAVRYNHPAIAQLLMEKGAKVNLLDKNGHSPLFLALEINYLRVIENPILLSTLEQNNIEVIRLLLANNANPNFADRNDVTLLMKAADCGNLKICKMLINHGADLNLRDSEGQTILMRSISKTVINPETVSILNYILERDHINVNIKNNLNQSPIFFFQKLLNHHEIFIKLIEKGMDITFNENGKTLITFLKFLRPRNYQEVIKSILKLHPEMKNENKVLGSRLQVSHSWHLGGNTSLTNSKGSSDASLLGGLSPIWFHQMSKNLSQFMINCPGVINHPEHFKDALTRAANHFQLTYEQKLEFIKKNNALFLNTGFLRHIVTVFIWGDRFIICNLGNGMRKPLDSFRFNPNLLTAEHLKEIDQIMNGTKEDYKKLFFEKLVLELDLKKEPSDIYLETLGEENLKKQTVGNCSWTSPMASIFAFFVLDSFTAGFSGQKLEETILKNIKTYHQWERFQKIYSLEKMLQLTGKLEYNTDFNLINQVDGKAKDDRLLDEQLSALMETYEMVLLTQMMSEKMSINEAKE